MSGSGTGPTIITLAVFRQSGSKGLAVDQNGDIFGVQPTNFYTSGGVFEIVNTSTGYSSMVDTVASATHTSGGLDTGPLGSVVLDAAGDLFGVEPNGGSNYDGTIYELLNSGTVGYSFQTLATFDGADGSYPSSVTLDSAGNLFGVTDSGSPLGAGFDNVFEVAKTATGYASTPTVIYNGGSFFTPIGGLLIDPAGDLFGESIYGFVFELVNNGNSGYTFNTIATIGGVQGGLVADAAGDLFGVTGNGGAYGYGSVFEIAKTTSGYASTPTTLVSFFGGDGSGPQGLIMDAAGDLFGTTFAGGAFNNGQGYGTVFEIVKSAGGYNNFPTTLINFDGTNGYNPDSGLVADAYGDLFGSTYGQNYSPTVFEVTDTGYQVSCFRQGTRIAVPGGARAVETLAAGEVVQTQSGALRPVIAMQHRALDCRNHPCPAEIWPVQVRAGAFAEGLPQRDLFLSPEHAVFFAGALIPIRHLINDATITQEQQDQVVYWHIELAQHDVLLAEGLPCESYLDTGNRDRATAGRTAAQAWAQEACAPLVETGARLAAAREHLAQRARVLGWTIAGSVDLPVVGAGWVRASIPAATDRVRLVCEAQRLGQDRRLLGALVAEIRLDGVRLGLDDARLVRGFHQLECHDRAQNRWTDGAATLLLGTSARPRRLEVHVTAAAA